MEVELEGSREGGGWVILGLGDWCSQFISRLLLFRRPFPVRLLPAFQGLRWSQAV